MAEFTEKDIYEAWGLGAQGQETADPAPTALQDTAEGAQGQEPADPAQAEIPAAEDVRTEPTGETSKPEKPEEDPGKDTDAGKQPLTPEQRRENAAKRRQQEQQAQQAAIDQAVQAAVKQTQDKFKAEMAEVFAKAGLKNSITGEPITNIEQFNQWNRQFQEAKLQRELKAGKLTEEGLATAIGNHPVVKQARELIDQDAANRKAQQEAQAKARIEGELEKIRKRDPSITSLEDLFKAPYGKEFYAMTQRGYSIDDAHYLLTKDTLEKAKLEAARQAGLNSVRSKEHLTATGGSRGSGAVSVPKEVLEMYHLFNPNATLAQIQEHYNKSLQKGG